MLALKIIGIVLDVIKILISIYRIYTDGKKEK